MTTHNPFWIQTHTPKGRFDLSAPRAEDVRIEDIAYSLSRLCRFTGYCNRFYSVAQHSIHVAEIVAETHPEWALAALLHDAEEAYIGDLSSPLKALIRSRGAGAAIMQGILHPIQSAIEDVFDLRLERPELIAERHRVIKAADLKMLATERRDLMPEPPDDDSDWYASTGVAASVPCGWTVPDWGMQSSALAAVEYRFMYSFAEYGGKP